MKLHQKPFHQSLIHQLLCQESQSLPEPTWELWQMLRPRTPGLSCGSPPPTEAGKRNPDPCPHVLPFTPDKQGLKVPLRDLGEKALTCAWGTASSRFAEAGGQDTLSASAPCSQYLLLIPTASKSPYPVGAASSLGTSSKWGFLAPSSSWYMSPCSSLTPVSSRDRVTSEHPCKPVATAQSTPALPSLPALSGVRPWLGFLTCSGTSLPGFSFTTESGSDRPGGRNPPKLPWLIFKHINPSP